MFFSEKFPLCQQENVIERPVRCSSQDLLDYLDGNFAIPEDVFDSDIEVTSQEPDNEESVAHIVSECFINPDFGNYYNEVKN